jgi:hypothetical protein
MKKGIFVTLMALIICQGCFSKESSSITKENKIKTVEQLFDNFSKEKNTIHVKVGGFAMSFARLFTDTKGVLGVEVYSFDECTSSVKERFNDAIKNVKDNAYETLVSVNEKGERVKVLVKIKDDIINEIVVLAGGDDPALVRIKGKIKPEDVKSVIENNK